MQTCIQTCVEACIQLRVQVLFSCAGPGQRVGLGTLHAGYFFPSIAGSLRGINQLWPIGTQSGQSS